MMVALKLSQLAIWGSMEKQHSDCNHGSPTLLAKYSLTGWALQLPTLKCPYVPDNHSVEMFTNLPVCVCVFARVQITVNLLV